MKIFAGKIAEPIYEYDYDAINVREFDIHLEEHPYQVSVQSHFKNKTKVHFCGGAIATENTVITAANCFIGKNVRDRDVIYVIAAGLTSLNNYAAEYYTVKNITLHPNFDNSLPLINNIAKVTVNRSFAWNHFVQPIEISDISPKRSSVCNVTGWTKDINSGKIMDDMVGLQLVMKSRIDCEKYLQKEKFNKNTMLCSTSFVGQIMCVDGCGTLLVCQKKLSGIRTGVPGDGCAIGYPERFTDLTKYYDWINNFTKSEAEYEPPAYSISSRKIPTVYCILFGLFFETVIACWNNS